MRYKMSEFREREGAKMREDALCVCVCCTKQSNSKAAKWPFRAVTCNGRSSQSTSFVSPFSSSVTFSLSVVALRVSFLCALTHSALSAMH